MGTVVADMTMSVDGFIADLDDGVGPLFDWYSEGHSEFTFPGNGMQAHVSEASAGHLERVVSELGALVTGRRLYDVAHAWDGSHPAGVPVFVVTHNAHETAPAGTTPFTFVTDGVASAIAQAQVLAGERTVVVASANITQQCLDLGLLDVIQVSLVPVLLGRGIPFFAGLERYPVMLEDPVITPGSRVTHMYFRVRR
jgi:dihydrofolate reductase